MQKIIDYIKINLNEEQSCAALHIHTSSLILAGAGSGKTRTLTYKIAYLLLGHRINPNKILAVTFTNKAANEMKERLMKLAEEMGGIGGSDEMIKGPSDKSTVSNISDKEWIIGSAEIATPKDKAGMTNREGQNNDSIDDFLFQMNEQEHTKQSISFSEADFKWVGTFHGIFLKILKEDIEHLGMKYDNNFGIFDSGESKTVIKEVLKQLGLQEVFKDAEAKNFISKLKNEGIGPKDFAGDTGSDYDNSMARVYEKYQRSLENSNMLDFDDLLYLPYILFKKHPQVLEKRQNRFDYIMVDEAQDTNHIQFELIRMLSGKSANITLIGDDFQSIYGRRGAVMENFLNIKSYRPDVQMFKLQINYRSRPHIVHASSHIIKNNVNQYEKNLHAHRKGDDKIIVFSHQDEMSEAANMIDFIRKMKGEKFKNWSDVAILYRTNAQSSPFEQILVQEGIPYKIWGAFKFFERKEIKDIVAYVKYIINPRDSVSLKRIINLPVRKIGKSSIDTMEEYAVANNISLHEALLDIANPSIDLGNAARGNIMEFGRLMHGFREEMRSSSPALLIQSIVKKINYKDHLIKEEGGNDIKAQEKYDNIGQLINMAERRDGEGDEPLRQFMEEVSLLTDAAEQNEANVDALQLMTVHASKGLEFPFVFIVGLEDNIFPLSNAMMEPKLLEEERRLMYVAITRAQDHVFLSYAHSRMQRGQYKQNPPSRFIAELPQDLLKFYELGGSGRTSASGKFQNTVKIDEGDNVRHKLFGAGNVLEVWNNLAIVRFHNPKFGVRKIETRFLELG